MPLTLQVKFKHLASVESHHKYGNTKKQKCV